MKRITFTELEMQKIKEFHKNGSSSVARERAFFLILASKNYSMVEISKLTGADYQKIQRFFKAWESSDDKYSTLFISPGRGPKVKLLPVLDVIKEQIKIHSKNLKPIQEYLSKEYKIDVCKLTLQNFLKEHGL